LYLLLSTYSGQNTVAEFCEYSDDPSDTIKAYIHLQAEYV